MVGKQDVFQQAMNQGHSAAWDGLWERAAVFYRQALDEIPDQPQALTNLGLALFELQNYEEALRVYQRAARLTPEDPLPLEKLAQLFERLGNLAHASQVSLRAAELYLKNKDVNKAIENWTRVTRLQPDNLQAHTRLALVHERLGNKAEAAAEYLAVASLLQASGDLERATRAVHQAINIIPDSEEARQCLVLLKENKPLPKPARPRGGTAPLRMAQVRQLEAPGVDAVSETSNDPITLTRQKALTVLAGMLFEGVEDNVEHSPIRRGLGAIVRGTGMSERSVDRSRIVLHLGQVVDLQTKGQNALAAGELERAIEAGLEHAAAFFDLGYLQAETGQVESALRHLPTAAQNLDFALGAHLLMGNLYRELNQLDKSAIHYLEALKQADALMVSPDQAEDLRLLYEPLIEVQSQQTDPSGQRSLCENISRLLNRADWRETLARARLDLPSNERGGLPTPLAEILTEASSSQIIESISKIYDLAHRGNLSAAMEEAFYAIQYAPTYLPLHTYMGELLLKQGQLQETINKFIVVARAYSIRGEPQRAISLYRRIIELAPMDLNARTRLIDQLISDDLWEDAIREYIDLAGVYYNLADLDMARKTYTEALRLAQQTNVDRALRVDILHRMADIDLQSLDWRQALRIFEQIRTLQPDDEIARLNLIDLNFRLGQEALAVSEMDNYINFLSTSGRKARAIQFVEDLVNEDPERVVLRRRMIELYRQEGRIKDLVKQLDALGDILLNKGDREGAIKAIEAILALNPPNKNEYMNALARIRNM